MFILKISKNKCSRVMFKIFGEQLLNGICVGNTLLLRSFEQVKEVSSLQKIRGYPYWIGPGWPGLGVWGLCWGQWKGCLEGLSGSRGLLSTWSCWQIYCSLCDHMTVMEMAGAVWVADGKKKIPLALCFSGCKNTAVFGFLSWLHTRFPILSSSLLPCWHSH